MSKAGYILQETLKVNDLHINFRCMVCRMNLSRNLWSGLYILVMFLMFLQVLGSPLVAYSRIVVGPFSSPGDLEFLLSTFGHVGSPPRHLKVGNKTWEHVEKCGEKCGNWEISRSGEDWWLKLLQLLPFQGTPECRKKTTTPWSLFPQTSRWGFGDQVHQLKKTKKLRHDKDSEKVQEAVHGVLSISHPVCVESRFRSFLWRPSSSSICQPFKVEGTTMKTAKKIQTCWTTSNLWQKGKEHPPSWRHGCVSEDAMEPWCLATVVWQAAMDAMHGCDTVEGTRLLRQVKALGFLGFKVIRRKKNNMMDTQSNNKVLHESWCWWWVFIIIINSSTIHFCYVFFQVDFRLNLPKPWFWRCFPRCSPGVRILYYGGGHEMVATVLGPVVATDSCGEDWWFAFKCHHFFLSVQVLWNHFIDFWTTWFFIPKRSFGLYKWKSITWPYS